MVLLPMIPAEMNLIAAQLSGPRRGVGAGGISDERRDVVVGVNCECGHACFLLLPLVVSGSSHGSLQWAEIASEIFSD